MLELVFVIVVIGIITAMVIPRMDRDSLFEATNQTLNHIKYTQHLAMTQDVYSDTDNAWFMRRWQMQFYACGGYVIHSDSNPVLGAAPGAPALLDAAIDPQTGKRLFTTNTCDENPAYYDKISLEENFGIINMALHANCGGADIAFDTLGRPYSNISAVNGVLKQNCDITLTSASGSEIIRIHPETGYACMLNVAGTACI